MFCLADLDHINIYFNNLINMLIENRYIIDLQIDMKNDLQKTNVFHIDMKKDFQINLKKNHHSIIRHYDYAFLL